MKLYISPGTCSKVSWITLEWAGHPYEVHKVSIHGEKSPELVEHNPMGSVPVLHDGDWSLTQNMAILNYLIDRYPEADIAGDRSPKTRAELNRWLGFINSDIHPLFKPYFGAAAYLEDEALIEKVKANAGEQIKQRFKIIDAHLKGRQWLVGDSHTPADAYLYVLMTWTQFLHIDLSAFEQANAHFARMSDDPAVQRVLAREAEFMAG